MPWKPGDFGPDPSNDVVEYEHAGQIVVLGHASTEIGEWGGLRHTWVENNRREWTTELIGHKTGSGFLVGTRLNCELSQTCIRHRPRSPLS